MAMRKASFLSLATHSRCHRLLMSAQSVMSIPSHPVSVLSQSVSNVLLACTGTPLTDAELTITLRAPAFRASRKGKKCFSRKSDGLI